MEKLVNENLNEFLGLGLKSKLSSLDPKDPADEDSINKLFKSIFKIILMNPHKSIIGTAARKLTIEEKYDLVRQYVAEGNGTLRLKNGKVVFMPEFGYKK